MTHSWLITSYQTSIMGLSILYDQYQENTVVGIIQWQAQTIFFEKIRPCQYKGSSYQFIVIYYNYWNMKESSGENPQVISERKGTLYIDEVGR